MAQQVDASTAHFAQLHQPMGKHILYKVYYVQKTLKTTNSW